MKLIEYIFLWGEKNQNKSTVINFRIMVTYGRWVLTGGGQKGNFRGDGDVPYLDRDTCHMAVYIS